MVARVAYGVDRERVAIDCGKFFPHLIVMVRVGFYVAIARLLLLLMEVARICLWWIESIMILI